MKQFLLGFLLLLTLTIGLTSTNTFAAGDLDTDGVDDSVVINNVQVSGEFTIEGFIYKKSHKSLSITDGVSFIFEWMSNNYANHFLRFSGSPDAHPNFDRDRGFSLYSDDNSWEYPNIAFNTDTWYHYAISRDSINRYFLYINGVGLNSGLSLWTSSTNTVINKSHIILGSYYKNTDNPYYYFHGPGKDLKSIKADIKNNEKNII